ncbi:hypothetical protein CfE428DRAFT_2115 [Chthoniobacter flavus Ellin428]|uniref:Uncharacterized protein n=1 Tax=Chthoniobacter flavus Ellin428 TaxID=497964 RepID=B4CZM7_9BACT|nr:hypothetical protein CfE428DRAFT_2115 [Chthoniobacter flavus Ellin428]
MLRVPVFLFEFRIERVIGGGETVLRVLRAPGAVDGVGNRIAQAGIDIEARAARQQTERSVDVLRRGVARCEEGQQVIDDGLVLPVHRGGLLGRVQILLKPGLEEAIVIHVPVLAVPGHDFRAGIEGGNILAQEAAFLAAAGAVLSGRLGRGSSGCGAATGCRSRTAGGVRDLGNGGAGEQEGSAPRHKAQAFRGERSHRGQDFFTSSADKIP